MKAKWEHLRGCRHIIETNRWCGRHRRITQSSVVPQESRTNTLCAAEESVALLYDKNDKKNVPLILLLLVILHSRIHCLTLHIALNPEP